MAITPFRVLSLESGGMKELCSAYFMKQFCIDAGIPVNGNYSDINKYFGLITGGLSALAYAAGYSPDYLITFFQTYGSQIFKKDASAPLTAAQKQTALDTDTFSPPANASFYGSGDTGELPNTVLAAQLTAMFGGNTLGQLKTNVLIPSIEYVPGGATNAPQYRFVLFSNLLLPHLEGQNYLCTDVASATFSTPLYFPAVTITANLDPDAVYLGVINNMAGLGLSLANALKQGSGGSTAVLSVSCGTGTVGFYRIPDPAPTPNSEPSNIFYLDDLLSVNTGGAQIAVNKQLEWMSKFDRNLSYFRFQTLFDPAINTELDNSSQEFLDYMQEAANAQYAADKQKILAFIQNANFNN